MFIRGIVLKDYRNFKEVQIDGFSGGINVFVGQNGQGKTNLIEAVNYLSCGRSFRSARDDALIRYGQESAHMGVAFSKKQQKGKVEAVLLRGKRRSVLIDAIPVRRISEMIGRIGTIVFAPEDLKTIKDRPLYRRQFLDIEISKLFPSYYITLQEYMLNLKSKNRLLKERSSDKILLETYNEQLIGLSKTIIEKRIQYTDKLIQYGGELFNELSPDAGALQVEYKCSADPTDLERSLRARLQEVLPREQHMRLSLVGPHREDLAFFLGGRDVRQFASQGQQRLTMIALKLAQVRIAYETLGDAPVLLLDDVFSELDKRHRKSLLDKMTNFQVFITATDATGVEGFTGANFYQVREGEIF